MWRRWPVRPLSLTGAPNGLRASGRKKHPGPVLYGISGHVERPGVYEYPAGMLITDLIEEVAGGVRGGKKLKAIVPGGASVPVLRADMIDGVTMDTESLREAGSMMGTAGMLVMDEDTDMVKFLRRVTRFYHHESCGQCTPCREGNRMDREPCYPHRRGGRGLARPGYPAGALRSNGRSNGVRSCRCGSLARPQYHPAFPRRI